jgi:hypothetical protein
MYFVLSHDLWLWKGLNSLLLTGLCFNLAYLLLGDRFWWTDRRQTAPTIWFICLCMGVIHHYVLMSGVFWIAASFFYLWAIFAGSVVMIPFRLRLADPATPLNARTAGGYVLPLLAGVYAGMGNEQVSLTLIGLALLAMLRLYRVSRKIDVYLLLLTGVIFASFLISWSAPGNRLRYEQEIIRWFPTWRELSLWQHLYLGGAWLLGKMINTNRMLLTLLFVLLAMILRRNALKRSDRLAASYAVFMAAFLCAASLYLDYLRPDMQRWLHDQVFFIRPLEGLLKTYANLGLSATFILRILPLVVWLPVLASIPWLLVRTRHATPLDGSTLAVLFCAAVLSAALMIASPTLYASAHRVLLVYSVIVVLILSSLYHSLAEKIPLEILAAITLIVILGFIFQVEEWGKGYFVHY